MESTKATRNIGGADVTFETGKLAMQAGGAATVTIGETQVLATSTSGTPREGIDFFPLTVDVEERMYAAGKIPGGFFRREGRPSETAILTARLTDRPMRPSFAEGFRDEVHIVVTVLSVDMAQPYDIPSINGASLATMLAGLPFEGPIGAVRVGNIGGQWKVNPTYQELDLATFDMVVAGRRNDEGTVDILMIEGEATDEAWRLVSEDGATPPTEDVVAEGLEAAKAAIGELIDFQREFVASGGRRAQALGAAAGVRPGGLRRGRRVRLGPHVCRAGHGPVRARREPRRAEGRDQGAPAPDVGRGRSSPRSSPRSRRPSRTSRRRSCASG